METCFENRSKPARSLSLSSPLLALKGVRNPTDPKKQEHETCFSWFSGLFVRFQFRRSGFIVSSFFVLRRFFDEFLAATVAAMSRSSFLGLTSGPSIRELGMGFLLGIGGIPGVSTMWAHSCDPLQQDLLLGLVHAACSLGQKNNPSLETLRYLKRRRVSQSIPRQRRLLVPSTDCRSRRSVELLQIDMSSFADLSQNLVS